MMVSEMTIPGEIAEQRPNTGKNIKARRLQQQFMGYGGTRDDMPCLFQGSVACADIYRTKNERHQWSGHLFLELHYYF
jgi:hypothetical protein